MKESQKTMIGGMIGLVGVAQPLEDGYGDGAIESTGFVGEAVADIMEEEVAVDLAVLSDVEHGKGDVETDPNVVVLG